MMSYINMLYDHSHWISCKQYKQWSILFVLENITFNEFFRAFTEITKSDRRVAEVWCEKLEEEAFTDCPESRQINIQIKPQSSGFTSLLDYLLSLLELCDPDDPEITLEDDLKYPEARLYGISEEYLLLEIEDYFLPLFEEYEKKY